MQPYPAVTSSPCDPLLLKIYGSCTDMSRWSPVLDELCAQTGAVSAVLQALHLDGERATTVWMAHDSYIDMDAYQATIADAGNPRLEAKRFMKVATDGTVVEDDGLFEPEEQPLRGRFTQQLLSLGLGRFVGGLVPLGDGQYVTLALHRRPGDSGDFSSRALDRLTGLMPHLAQAVSLSQSVALNRSASALLHGHLENWPCAMVVCDVQGNVNWLNRRATLALHSGGELRFQDRQLRALPGRAQQRFERALKMAAESQAATFAAFDTCSDRLHMAVQPLDTEGLLLVTLTRDDVPGRIPVEALKVLFELTDAEARLASALVAGSTVEQYAQLRGVTVGTARYQLNQVLLKTGAHRQADLVRRVLCSAAAQLASRSAVQAH